MKRFKSILVICTDNSRHELAVDRARKLAKANDATITLMDVVDIDHRELASVFSTLSARFSGDMQNQIFDYHRIRIEHYAALLRAA